MPTNNVTSTTNLNYAYSNSFTASSAGSASETVSQTNTAGTAGVRQYAFASGLAANQIDTPASVSASLTTASTVYSLSSFPSPNGNQAFIKLKKIVVENNALVAGNDLVIDGTVANSIVSLFQSVATAKLTIRAGGVLVLIAPLDGFLIALATADQLKVTAIGTVPYRIILEGTSV